jgi:hypothetical protein
LAALLFLAAPARTLFRALGRLAERPLALAAFVGRVDRAARPAFRLAIGRCPFEP